jgi:hypothetical protein
MKSEKNNNDELNKDCKAGSQITDPDEKELRKHDDWRAHKHEKHRDVNDEYRESELHGAVGKEIIEVIEKDKPRQFRNQNIDYGLDINKDKPHLEKHVPKDFNNKSLDPRPQENINAIKETEKMLERIEHGIIDKEEQ